MSRTPTARRGTPATLLLLGRPKPPSKEWALPYVTLGDLGLCCCWLGSGGQFPHGGGEQATHELEDVGLGSFVWAD